MIKLMLYDPSRSLPGAVLMLLKNESSPGLH